MIMFQSYDKNKYKNLNDIIDIYEFQKHKLFMPVFDYIQKLSGKLTREEYLKLKMLCVQYKDNILKVLSRCNHLRIYKIPSDYYFILKEDINKKTVNELSVPICLPDNLFEDIDN